MTRKRLLGVLLAAGLLMAMIVPAVASHTDSGRSHIRHFGATLRSSAEVPAVDTAAQGMIQVYVDLGSHALCWDLTSSLSMEAIVGMHIHRGVPGVNGPVVIDLLGEGFAGGDQMTQRCSNTVDRSVLAAVARFPRRHYVNVHTSDHPGGEMRGQLNFVLP